MRRAGVLMVALVLSGCPPEPLETPELVYGLDEHWAQRSTYPGVGAGRIVVTNSFEDSVSLFDLSQVGQPVLPELARVPVGLLPPELEGLHHAALHPEGTAYFVGISNYAPGSGSGPHGAHGTGASPGHVLKLRARDNVMEAEARVDRNPGDLVLTADGKRVLVSHFDLLKVTEVQQAGGSVRDMDSRLVVLDGQTLARDFAVAACPAAHGIAVTQDGGRAFLACASDEVAVVDLAAADHPVTRVPLRPGAGDPTASTHLPYALALSPDGLTLWTACLEGKDLHALDTATLTFDPARTVAMPGASYFPMFNAEGTRLYVPHQSPDGIAIVDAATGALLKDLPAQGCVRPHAMRLAPDGVHALLVCEGNHREPGALVVLNLTTETITSNTAVGLYPDFVGVLRSAQ